MDRELYILNKIHRLLWCGAGAALFFASIWYSNLLLSAVICSSIGIMVDWERRTGRSSPGSQ